jgi:hypothetical protein
VKDFVQISGGRFEIFMVSWDSFQLDGAWVLARLDLLVLTIIMFSLLAFNGVIEKGGI